MYKLGVCYPQDLHATKNWFGKEKNFAYTLLKTSLPATAREIEVFEKVILSVQLSSGVFRTTFRNRFADIEETIQQILREYFNREQALNVQDWAASDILASKEWADLLLKDFPQAKLTASDYILYLIEASRHEHEYFIFEPDGTPLQYIRAPFVLPLTHKESLVYPVNMLLRQICLSRLSLLSEAVRTLKWQDIFDNKLQERYGWELKKLLLIHPEAMNFNYQEPRFNICFHDVFTPLAEPCHVLRTMNIYNHCYFPEERLQKGFQAVMASLVEGGIWIVGKTFMVDHKNHVSIYRKENNRLRLIETIGNGFECKEFLSNYLLD